MRLQIIVFKYAVMEYYIITISLSVLINIKQCKVPCLEQQLELVMHLFKIKFWQKMIAEAKKQ